MEVHTEEKVKGADFDKMLSADLDLDVETLEKDANAVKEQATKKKKPARKNAATVKTAKAEKPAKAAKATKATKATKAKVTKTKAAAKEPTRKASSDRFQKTLDATQLYLNEIGFSPLLTPEEEVYYARMAMRGEEAGRKRMIESNLRLVVKIARRYVNRGLSL